ncbi:hypothetical protein GI582_08735 [Sulfitobacter sp. BDSS02]|nr:hypothetical protein [Sulfitobacter sp. BDSS02]MBR9850619.1 hypothetical protein [Paracoccaceae bacterium]
MLRHPLVRRILPDLHAEAARSTEMRAINDRVAQARRERAEDLLDRWTHRGELPKDLDRNLALDLLVAPLYWRMVVCDVIPTYAELERQSRAIVAGLTA